MRTSKARGADKDLPSCSHWPHNVRPGDFYQGAYVPAIRDTPQDLLHHFTDPAMQKLYSSTVALLLASGFPEDVLPDIALAVGNEFGVFLESEDDLVEHLEAEGEARSILDPKEVSRAQFGPRELKDPRSRA